jgi:hypothetical protein
VKRVPCSCPNHIHFWLALATFYYHLVRQLNIWTLRALKSDSWSTTSNKTAWALFCDASISPIEQKEINLRWISDKLNLRATLPKPLSCLNLAKRVLRALTPCYLSLPLRHGNRSDHPSNEGHWNQITEMSVQGPEFSPRKWIKEKFKQAWNK